MPRSRLTALARACRAVLLAALLAVPAAHAGTFRFQDLQGKTHTLEHHRGKWVLVNFWATWCPPCLDEIPELVALHDERRDLVVIGVVMDWRDAREIGRFVDNYFISYPVVLGNRKLAEQIAPPGGLPASYLYNPQGKLVARHVGPLTKKAVSAFIAGKAS